MGVKCMLTLLPVLERQPLENLYQRVFWNCTYGRRDKSIQRTEICGHDGVSRHLNHMQHCWTGMSTWKPSQRRERDHSMWRFDLHHVYHRTHHYCCATIWTGMLTLSSTCSTLWLCVCLVHLPLLHPTPLMRLRDIARPFGCGTMLVIQPPSGCTTNFCAARKYTPAPAQNV